MAILGSARRSSICARERQNSHSSLRARPIASTGRLNAAGAMRPFESRFATRSAAVSAAPAGVRTALTQAPAEVVISLRDLTAIGAEINVTTRLPIMPRTHTHADVFRAIADPTRRAILDRLRAGPAKAGVLAADFRSSRPAVSKHLRVLRQARLVVDRRVGRERVYTVNPMPLQSIAGWLEGYRMFWETGLTKLKRNLEEK